MRRLDGPPTIQPALLVTPLPKRFLWRPRPPAGQLVPSYLRWRRRAPIGRWPTPALARPRLTM